uniref:Zinc metalloproteinase n=1 Tax=Strongyloides stercoralis TaxID=6248 RepID=A0A0K0EP91_STRER
MKFFFEILFTFACLPFIFGGLTHLRIQQQTRENMGEDSKKVFDKHTKAMAELSKISNKLHGVQVSNADDKTEIEITPRGNPSMYQGDMILTEGQANMMLEEAKLKLEAKESNKTGDDVDKEIINKLKKNRAYKKDSRYKWKFPIPYFIERGVEQTVVDNALRNIAKETCLTFQKSAPFNNRQGLRIFRGQGCYSFIGPISDSKPQDVSIGRGCEWNGIVQHEVCHALGLFHEQSRPDRDDFLMINLNNVLPNQRHNYDKSSIASTETFGIPYDYGSHMQYDKKSFSFNNQLTMIPRNRDYLNTIGQFDKMQFNDIKLINSIYCADRCKGGIQCYNGGYEDPMRCGTCKCPSMLEGNDCRSVRRNPPECGTGSTLKATETIQSFKLKGVKNCVFLVNAPPGKRAQINIDRGYFNQTERCFPGIALEVKFNKDKTITGPTFCGSVNNKGITGESSNILFQYVGTRPDHFLEMRYRAV